MSSQDKEVDDNLFIWFMDKFNKHRISVHAAHVTFFMLVSFFPFMMFLLLFLKYTPVSLENILSLSKRVIPAGLQPVLFFLAEGNFFQCRLYSSVDFHYRCSLGRIQGLCRHDLGT